MLSFIAVTRYGHHFLCDRAIGARPTCLRIRIMLCKAGLLKRLKGKVNHDFSVMSILFGINLLSLNWCARPSCSHLFGRGLMLLARGKGILSTSANVTKRPVPGGRIAAITPVSPAHLVPHIYLVQPPPLLLQLTIPQHSYSTTFLFTARAKKP